MTKLSNDSDILTLQHKLQEAGDTRRQAERDGCSEIIIVSLMDAEDAISDKLVSMGCHIRDCR